MTTHPTDTTPAPLDALRRAAKRLHKAYERGDRQAVLQIRQWLGDKPALKHADFLHAVARERGFPSWPKLKVTVEAEGLSRAEARERFGRALLLGQKVWIERLLSQYPDLAAGHVHLACATYDVGAVRDALAADPKLATQTFGGRRPILHLCFSHWGRLGFGAPADALAIAQMLVAAGADVNDGTPSEPGSDHLLPVLYGAISHAQDADLVRYLLDEGANPNDNESLYHATEHRDLRALEMLLARGAVVAGTNAFFRAMDFDDLRAVEMMIAARADVNEGVSAHPSGPATEGLSALHHAAQRGVSVKMVEALVAHGAQLDVRRDGLTAYAVARIYGSDHVAEALAHAGVPQDMPPGVAALVAGQGPLDPATLPDEVRALACELAVWPDSLPRLKQLIAAGLEWDRPNRQGLTPVQMAGWSGLPDTMAFFLKMRPDLSHVNGYGGTLLSTIIHGSENAGPVEGQDHVACLELALKEGVAIPRPALRHAGREDVLAFLEDWAERYPGQVVDHGIA
ncbi:MAG: ankyrin repeat domain-containing protein [Pseudomonadota bacterium]